MTRALARLLLVLAATPARAQPGDPEPRPTERLDAGAGLRVHQDSLITVAVSAGAMRGALLAALRLTGARAEWDH